MVVLREKIRTWARELGFQAIGISEAKIPEQHIQHLRDWLAKGYHGDMTYMAERVALRAQPEQLHPGVVRIISARMDYLPADTDMVKMLNQPEKAYVSRYALGRDYHKLIRKRLTLLGQKIDKRSG